MKRPGRLPLALASALVLLACPPGDEAGASAGPAIRAGSHQTYSTSEAWNVPDTTWRLPRGLTLRCRLIPGMTSAPAPAAGSAPLGWRPRDAGATATAAQATLAHANIPLRR